MTRWAMVADLERCVGCQTCTAACRHANATSPAVQWRKVLDIEAGSYPNVSRTFVPVGCQHCADPPCMHVCPTTATRQRADGIVTIDYDLCIGCAYCEVACPYQARFLVRCAAFCLWRGHAERDRARRPGPLRRGAKMHLLLGPGRLRHRKRSRRRGSTRVRRRPASIPASPTRCILAISTIQTATSRGCCASSSSFRMHEELGTEPGFYYLYGKANDAGTCGDRSLAARRQLAGRHLAPAVSSRGTSSIGTGRRPAISSAAVSAPGYSLFTAVASLRYGELAPLGWSRWT